MIFPRTTNKHTVALPVLAFVFLQLFTFLNGHFYTTLDVALEPCRLQAGKLHTPLNTPPIQKTKSSALHTVLLVRKPMAGFYPTHCLQQNIFKN